MRKLIVEEWMSLDGYVADKNGNLDFFTSISPEENTYSDQEQLKFLESIDTILLGRKTYELFEDFWPNATTEQEAIADKLNSIPKIVVSNTLQKAPWGNWSEAKIMSGEAVEGVRTLKGMPGKDIVLWGSISLAQALMKADLVDEYRIQLCPCLTGGGRSFFTGLDFTKLQLVETRKYNTGTIFLNYRAGAKGSDAS